MDLEQTGPVIELREARQEDLAEIVRLLADDPLGGSQECDQNPLPVAYCDALAAIGDGEPIEPEPQTGTGVIRTTRRKENAYDPKGVGRTPPTRIRVRLADGKERAIQHMESTTFWHPDGKPMSAQQFMESLFGFLPQFFANEQELRDLWSKPDTRAHLLSNSQKKASAKTNYTKCN